MLLDAGASDVVGVTKLEFHLTGGSLNHTLIATATGTRYGWLANWNSTTVPDGTYTLQSFAYDAAGNQGGSTGVTIIVENTPPKPTITIPSNGSWVSGGVFLGASAPANVGVTQVQFSLTGGSLYNVPIAQGGPSPSDGSPDGAARRCPMVPTRCRPKPWTEQACKQSVGGHRHRREFAADDQHPDPLGRLLGVGIPGGP